MPMDYERRVAAYQNVAAWFHLPEGRDAVLLLANEYYDAVRGGHTIWLAGNGGSAADAQHVAAELVGRFLDPGRRPIDARALTVDTSILTAISNDFGYAEVFAQQLDAGARDGDLLVMHSTSGVSENLLRAFMFTEIEPHRVIHTITVLGSRDRCGRSPLAQPNRNPAYDWVVFVPGADGMSTQLGQMMLQHLALEMLEERLRG